MPKTKRPHQLCRRIAYLVHLRNLAAIAHEIERGREPTAPELAKLLEVNPRTIHRYLATLRLFGAPLKFDVARNGFYLTRSWNFEEGLLLWLKKNRLRSPRASEQRARKQG
jgi:predicted DNA-binding transcriptional regulator YafY